MITPSEFFEQHDYKVIQQHEFDIELHAGDTRMMVLRLRDRGTQDLVDLTGARLHFAAAGSLTSPYYDSPVIEKHSGTHPGELYVYDASEGIMVLRLGVLDTLNLMPRDYPYALSFANALGDAQVILTGKLKVRRTVGRLTGKLFYHKQKWNGSLEGVDGVNLDFELEATPEPNSTVVLFEGVVQTEGIDYLIIDKKVHFIDVPPDAGKLVEAIYPSIEP